MRQDYSIMENQIWVLQEENESLKKSLINAIQASQMLLQKINRAENLIIDLYKKYDKINRKEVQNGNRKNRKASKGKAIP